MPRALIASALLFLAGVLVTERSALEEMPHEGALEANLIGRSATFPTGAIAIWHSDGRYSYRPSRGGRTWLGRYTISGSLVCVELFDEYGDILGAGWGGMGSCFRLARADSGPFLIDRLGRFIPLDQAPVPLDRTEDRHRSSL